MHIAIIMDGNRRWAVQNSLPKLLGHREGLKNLEKFLEICPKNNIEILTVYALSTENLQRSNEELDNLFSLINSFAKKIKKFNQNNIKVKILGNINLLREDCQKSLDKLQESTKNNTGLLFQICLAYGGRDELVRACKKIKDKNLEISEETIKDNLDSGSEPEIIIRTGGHSRLSNFLMWQSAYSELFFVDKMWPDFGEKDLQEILKKFAEEERKFGK